MLYKCSHASAVKLAKDISNMKRLPVSASAIMKPFNSTGCYGNRKKVAIVKANCKNGCCLLGATKRIP